MCVLVTGATGFVGSRLAPELVAGADGAARRALREYGEAADG